MPRRSITYGESTSEGITTPVLVERIPQRREKAGYAPDALDVIINQLLSNARQGAEMLGRHAPMLDELMIKLQDYAQSLIARTDTTDPDPQLLNQFLDVVDRVSQITERINKMMFTNVRAKDEATRLRIALVGDEMPRDLEHLSDTQLRRMVTDAAQGWQKPIDDDDAS
jgi:hypothetical protein